MVEDNKDRKRRGFFGRLLVGLLTILAWIGVLAMALSVLSGYINPARFVWASFFGLAFWEILAFNIILFFLLMLLWSRRIWVTVLALAIAVPGIHRSFSNGKVQEGGELRVMSYNVQVFEDLYDSNKNKADVALGVINVVREQHPDVLCVQEFGIFIPKTTRNDCIKQFGDLIGMPYCYYHTKAYFGGNVIYSQYPLSPLKDKSHIGNENDYGAVCEVDAGKKGKFIVVCAHLASFRLTKEEVTVFSEPGNSKQDVQEYGKSIISKLKRAYRVRSEQVDQLLKDIPHDGRAMLLCGDFNDTPLSYTYHNIKKAGFTDGFVVAGHGIGHTYAGKLPLLRIDYVWGNEWIQPTKFKRLRFKGSDHYPVVQDFKILQAK